MNRKWNKFGKIKAYNLDKFTLYSFVSRIRNAHERTRCRERSSFRPGRWLPSTVAPFVENSDTFDSGRSHLVNQRRKISIHREMVARYLDTSRDFAKRKKDHTDCETFVSSRDLHLTVSLAWLIRFRFQCPPPRGPWSSNALWRLFQEFLTICIRCQICIRFFFRQHYRVVSNNVVTLFETNDN